MKLIRTEYEYDLTDEDLPVAEQAMGNGTRDGTIGRRAAVGWSWPRPWGNQGPMPAWLLTVAENWPGDPQ